MYWQYFHQFHTVALAYILKVYRSKSINMEFVLNKLEYYGTVFGVVQQINETVNILNPEQFTFSFGIPFTECLLPRGNMLCAKGRGVTKCSIESTSSSNQYNQKLVFDYHKSVFDHRTFNYY